MTRTKSVKVPFDYNGSKMLPWKPSLRQNALTDSSETWYTHSVTQYVDSVKMSSQSDEN